MCICEISEKVLFEYLFFIFQSNHKKWDRFVKWRHNDSFYSSFKRVNLAAQGTIETFLLTLVVFPPTQVYVFPLFSHNSWLIQPILMVDPSVDGFTVVTVETWQLDRKLWDFEIEFDREFGVENWARSVASSERGWSWYGHYRGLELTGQRGTKILSGQFQHCPVSSNAVRLIPMLIF